MKFSDIPYFLITKYINDILRYKSNEYSSYLIGGKTTIMVGGGDTQNFYLKSEGGFLPVKLQPTPDDDTTDNKFRFIKKSQLTESDEIQYEITDTYHSITTYTKEYQINYQLNGYEIYFRKDSPFHEWLKKYAANSLKDDHGVDFITENYVNTDKSYVYFGEIFQNIPPLNGYHIIHRHYRDFVREAIPYHQRTEKLKKFIDLNFDVLYTEQYTRLKNIFSLLDPYEVNYEYIDYIMKMYNFSLLEGTEESIQRDLVNGIINLIKKKGTFEAFYLLWKIITNNTPNRLNIFERWHYKEPFINKSDKVITQTRENQSIGFTDVIFPSELKIVDENNIETDPGLTYFKNAQIIEENNGGNPWIITTRNEQYFKNGFSVSQVRNENGKIIFPNTLTSLNENFLEVDPFEEVFARENDYRLNITSYELINGVYVYHIKHNLNSKVLVSVFDGNIEVIPHEIELVNSNNLKIKTFDELQDGYVNIVKSDKLYTIDDYYINIEHNLNTYGVLVQCFDLNGFQIVPDEINIINKNSLNILFNENVKGEVLLSKSSEIYEGSIINLIDNNNNKIWPKRLYENPNTGYYMADFETDSVSGHALINAPIIEIDFDKESDVWEAQHDLNSIQLIVQVRSGGDYIIPKNIEFSNYNSVTVTFDEEISGTLLIGHGFEIHESGDKNYVSKNAWLDFLYTNYYGYDKYNIGSGDVYYDTYVRNDYPQSHDEYVLSTHYKLEMDLTTSPISNDGILSKQMSDTFDYYWEKFRPINRVADYNLLISPITDFTGKYNYLYSTKEFSSYLKTKSVNFSLSLKDTHLGIMPENETWTVSHNLGSKNVFVQCVDEDLMEIVPENILSVDKNTLKIDFNAKVGGYVLVKKEHYVTNEFTPVYTVSIKDYWEQKELLTQVLNEDDEVIIPNEVKWIDENEVYVDLDGTTVNKKEPTTLIKLSNIPEEIQNDAYVYTVNHLLNEYNIKVDVYDSLGNKVYPRIRKLNDNTLYINSPDDISDGHVVIDYDWDTIAYSESNFIYLEHGWHTTDLIVQCKDGSGEIIQPNSIEFVNLNTIKVGLDLVDIEKVNVLVSKTWETLEDNDGTVKITDEQKEVIVQVLNEDDTVFIPDEIKWIDENEVYVDPDGTINKKIPTKLIELSTTTIDVSAGNYTFTVNHNMNDTNLITGVYDNSGIKIYPDIKYQDNNNLTLKTTENIYDGYVLIDYAWASITYDTGETTLEKNENDPIKYIELSNVYSEITDKTFIYPVNHNLNEIDVLVDVYDSNDRKIYPVIERKDNNTTVLSSSESISDGYVLIDRAWATAEYNQPISQKEIEDTFIWAYDYSSNLILKHQLNTKELIVQCKDKNGNIFKPDQIEFINDAEVRIILDLDTIGGFYVMLSKISETIENAYGDIKETGSQKQVLTQIVTDDYKVIIPDEIKLIDENNISVDPTGNTIYKKVPTNFSALSTATEEISGSDYIYTYTHNLDSSNLVIDVYNSDDIKIYPNIKIFNDNTIVLNTTEDISGGYILMDYAWATFGYDDGVITTYKNEKDQKERYKNVTINHGLDSKELIVQCRDENDKTLMLNHVKFINNNEIEIDLEYVENATIMISKTWETLKELEKYKIRHNERQTEVLTQFRDLDYNIIYPNVELIDNNFIGTNIGSGIVSFHKPDQIIIQPIKRKVWDIQHDLDNDAVIFSAFYDEDNNKIFPKDFEIINKGTTRFTFDKEISGYVLISEVGDTTFVSSLRKSNVVISEKQDNMESISYTQELNDFFEDGQYYYIRADIPTENNYSIKSMGIIDSFTKDLIVYSECSEIYKREGTSLTIFYKLSKGNF